ncbi:MAG: hypothetical protein ACRENU_02350, partial [Gemmatimonadaceae bacterium]
MKVVPPARNPRRRGSRPQAAATLFSAVLMALVGACAEPVDTSWYSDDGYRWRALDVPRRGSPGFTLLDSARSGVAFVNSVSDSLLLRNRILAQGGG